MRYATLEDIQTRSRRQFSENEIKSCLALLEDAGTIIDVYNKNASEEAKKLVSCNMIVRAIGNGEEGLVPIGTTQGTVSGMGYSQTWTMGSGATGELYLNKLDKKLLGVAQKIGFTNPFMEVETCSEE